MQSHEIDYEILGHDIQLVEVELDPDETVIAEAGALTYMQDDIEFETRMGDGADPDEGFMGKLFGAGKRLITGESLFMTHFTNRGSGKRALRLVRRYQVRRCPLTLRKRAERLSARRMRSR